jgi:8-oxo-dGTP pyrophosphatase MutT (NUDIX family)
VPGPQVIPRPSGHRAGAPSPWYSLNPEARTGLTVARVVRTVDDATPTLGHPSEYDVTGLRPSAVLVAVFEEPASGEAAVVLTRRARTLRSHTHQVSFPGGRIDVGESAREAALRETWEEVGIPAETLAVVGQLPPLATFAGGSAIAPWLATLDAPPVLRPNPAEVERAFTVTFAELAADGCHWEERWPFPDGGERDIHFFDLPEDLVWGATARILLGLLSRVLGVSEPPGWGG